MARRSRRASRFATNRRVLAEAGDSIKRFYDSGVLELGDRLGPVLWQFAPTKKFDQADFGKFLELLPRKLEGRALRHVVEVRNPSFRAPDFIALLRRFETPVVFAEHGTYPAIADVAGDFLYARLQKGNDGKTEKSSARCLRLRDSRRQDTRSRGRDGIDPAFEIIARWVGHF